MQASTRVYAAELCGHRVPEAMLDEARHVKAMGGKAFLSIAELPAFEGNGCANCNGTGQLQLQQVVGGPFDSPRASGRDTSSIFEAGSWYTVKTAVYSCPVCMAATWR